MRRSYRTGAAAAATATLLTGVGIALTSLRVAPSEVATVTSVSTPAESDLETLDASLADLRTKAAELKAEIAARTKAADAAKAPEPSDGSTEPGKRSATVTGAPATDATTGASGAGDAPDTDEPEEHEQENGDDD